MEPVGGSVVVGVTGRGENTDALRFAAREAEIRGRGVTLAHVVPPRLPASRVRATSTDEPWREVGGAVAEAVRAELSQLTGARVPVATLVRQGRAGPVLSELSADAALIVLQHRDLSRLHRYVTGSTVASVAAHASCPVVSVPHGWSDQGPAVVGAGVHEDGGPAVVLEGAFAEAALRGSSLRVVHAWRVASAYGDMFVEDVAGSGQLESRIQKTVAEVGAQHPEISVQVEVRHEYGADALVSLSAEVQLLVVGRHSHVPVLPHFFGSLARTVVEHGRCPVMVVPM